MGSHLQPEADQVQNDFRTSLGVAGELNHENIEYEITQFNPAIFDQHKMDPSSSYHSRGLNSQNS